MNDGNGNRNGQRHGGAAAAGPSPQFQALLEGRITSTEYVRELKRRISAERQAEARMLRRAAA